MQAQPLHQRDAFGRICCITILNLTSVHRPRLECMPIDMDILIHEGKLFPFYMNLIYVVIFRNVLSV